MSDFHAHHYNFVAKRLRENCPTESGAPYNHIRFAILKIALDFAAKFKEDNPNFDPLKFLDACSPDPERLPFSEAWADGSIDV